MGTQKADNNKKGLTSTDFQQWTYHYPMIYQKAQLCS